MSELVSNCPRCKASKTTFDVFSSNDIGIGRYGWNKKFEAYSVCRNCRKGTVFILELKDRTAQNTFLYECASFKGSISPFFIHLGHVSLKDSVAVMPPEFLPEHIEAAFREGATCLAVECFNAAATMFRLCVDYATQDLLPKDGEVPEPNRTQRRDLGHRLQWLFDNKKLPDELHDLAHCIKEDGNDAAHRGTIQAADAEDLLDFTVSLLESRYTYPKRIAQASARRATRSR
jgi:hypothetical protein